MGFISRLSLAKHSDSEPFLVALSLLSKMDGSDNEIANLMTDGYGMGIKSLNRYRNQYKAADEVSKDITKRLINLEEKLAVDIREYL